MAIVMSVSVKCDSCGVGQPCDIHPTEIAGSMNHLPPGKGWFRDARGGSGRACGVACSDKLIAGGTWLGSIPIP